MQIPTTSFPQLDTLDRTRVDALTSLDSSIEQWNREWDSSLDDDALADACQLADLEHFRVLRKFAAFLHYFTISDEVSFRFTVHADGQKSVSTPSSGVVHSTSEARPFTGDSQSEDTLPSIVIHREANLEEFAFGISIDARRNDEETPDLPPAALNAFLDRRGVTIRYLSAAIPTPVRSPIFDHLYRILKSGVLAGPVESSARDANLDGAPALSILNHPPCDLPLPLPVLSNTSDDQPALQFENITHLHDEFVRRAQEYPDRLAIDFVQAKPAQRVQYTYRELDHITTGLAEKIRMDFAAQPPLHHHGQQMVAAFITTSPELYISWLAVLKAGCAFVPLPVEAPMEFLAGIVEDVESPVILGRGSPSKSWKDFCRGSTPPRPWLDVAEFAEERHLAPGIANTNFFLPPLQAQDVAYVMFTSGSTGKPKGVPVTHLSATCSISSNLQYLPHEFIANNNEFRWFQFTAPTFDASVLEIFVTLSAGGTLCACDRALTVTDPEGAITSVEADIMMTVPSMGAFLRPEKVPTLHHLWTIGEALGRTLIDNFAYDSETRPAHDPRHLLNTYGPTECAIDCTLSKMVSVNERGSIIGTPLPTCSIFVIDPEQQQPVPVPLGFPGELAVGGPHVSPSYLRRPDADVAFVPSKTYGRLYRTGDRARIVVSEDGTLVVDFLGRISTEQIKLNGRRVELGEIEAAMAHPLVMEAAAIAAAPQSGSAKKVVMFIVPRESFDKEELLRVCHENATRHLQPHMRPSQYFLVSQMPRTASEKLNRKALENMYRLPAGHDLTPLGPTESSTPEHAEDVEFIGNREILSTVQHAIADAVQGSREDVKPSRSLGSLGLDSLRAVRFLQQARELGLASLLITDVLSCSSVADLVHAFEQADEPSRRHEQDRLDKEWEATWQGFRDRQKEDSLRLLALDQQDVETFLPTTAQQSALLSGYILSLASSQKTYIEHSVYVISSDLNPEEVCGAWINVLERHEIMRTVFAQVDDDLSPFAQCVLKPTSSRAAITLGLFDSEGSPGSMFDDLIARAIKEAEDRITLEKPPFAISLVQVPGRSAVVFSVLHAIFDGASLRLLLHDVEREFRGLTPLKRPGVEVAAKRHFTADQDEVAEHWRWYLQHATFEPFPCLRRTLCTEEDMAKCETRSLVSDLTITELRAIASRMGASPLAVLQIAWASILSAYTGSADVTFGTTMSDRFTPELAACCAPLMAIVPVRVDMTDDSKAPLTNAEVARMRTKENSDSLRYLQHPFPSVATNTKCSFQSFEGPSGTDLLYDDVIYSAMPADEDVMIEMWAAKSGFIELRTTYQCRLLDTDAADLMLMQLVGIMTNMGSNPDAPFRATRCEPPLEEGTLAEIEQAALAEDDIDEDETAERSRMLLHQSFREHAREKPDDLALAFYWDLATDTTKAPLCMTYGELNARAEAVAAEVVTRLQGEPRPWVVPISMEKCPDLYVAVLGVLIAGATWCPIDPSYPPARQNHLIERTATKVVLVNSPLAEDAVPDGIDTVDVTTINRDPATTALILGHPSFRRPRSRDIAYILFTSGTTGLPKGVPITHEAVTTSLTSLAHRIAHGIDEMIQPRHVQFVAFTFDVFVMDLFLCWSHGGTIYSATRDILLGQFADLANLVGANHAMFTPTFASTLRRADFGPSMRGVLIGGEALPQATAKEWSEDGAIAVYNLYGPAEAAINSTSRRVYGTTISSNIGHALPSVEAEVIGRDGHLIMRNAVGELVLSGVHLTPGYWRDPQMTAKAFRWNNVLGKKVYHTGDIVRQLADGSFDFVSRADDMVKIRGMRVELDEIVSVCRAAHPLISHAHVLYTSPPDAKASAGKVLVCFLAVPAAVSDDEAAAEASGEKVLQKPSVLQGDEQSHAVALAARSHASSQLPQHMVPELFIVLSHIPLTRSAKVDRHALRALFQESGLAAGQAPSGQLSGLDADESDAAAVDPEWESRNASLCNMLRNVVKMPDCNIGPRTTLVELGLDSIGAIKLSGRLRREDHNVTVTDLICCRTVGDLVSLVNKDNEVSAQAAEAARDQAWKDAADHFSRTWKPRVAEHMAPTRDIDSFDVAPTTRMQASVLAESLRTPMSYWANHCYELSNTVDTTRLRQAWESVTAAYELLRTGFALKAALVGNDDTKDSVSLDTSGFLQVIRRESVVDWDECQIDIADMSSKAGQMLDDMAKRHSSLSFAEPLWGIRLLAPSDGSPRIMVINIHHSLYDGDSIPLLLEDLNAAYEASFDSTTVTKPETNGPDARCQLTEAITRLNLQDNAEDGAAFWQQHLGNLAKRLDSDSAPTPASYMSKPPSDQPARHRMVQRVSALSLPDLTTAARSIGGASANAIFRVAWGLMLAEYSESDAGFLFAEIRSERMRDPRLEKAVAPLAGLYPVPFILESSPRDMVRAQFRLGSECLKYGALDGGSARRILGRGAEEVLYPAMLVFHSKEESRKHGLFEARDPLVPMAVEHNFVLNVYEQADDGILLALHVEERTMPEEVQAMLLAQLDATLQGIVSHSDISSATEINTQMPESLRSVSRLRPSFVDKAPADWHPTHWIEHWADMCPDACGVEILEMVGYSGEKKTTSWTYAQLNSTANQVARWILQQGINERKIGLCLNRSLLSFAVIVGIMKSGNTYIPIDEDLPLERKRFLLEDGNAAALFTAEEYFTAADDLPKELRIVDVEKKDFVDAIAALDASNIRVDVPLTSDSYILYTSGSTGKPKGVRVSRGNLSAFMEAQNDIICTNAPSTPSLAGKGKYLCLASRAFDVHIGEMFLAWRHGLAALAGARMTLLDNLRWTLAELHVTHASFVPSLLDQTGLVPDDAPDLVFLSTGGEKMTPRTQAVWSSSSHVALINAYGPTEITVGCCSGRVLPDSDTRCIGRPLGDSIARVLVPGTDRPAKRGVPGELAFSGSLVANGYLNLPPGAASGFVEDSAGGRMYRTGDIVVMLSDDSILFLGRKDDQVKVRGQRLELGEISEAARAAWEIPLDVTTTLLKHPEMPGRQQLVTFVAAAQTDLASRKNGGSEKEPAFLLSNEDRAMSTVLMKSMTKRLPAYMVPDLVLPISYVPLTATSAKADHKLLKRVFEAMPLAELQGDDDGVKRDRDASQKKSTRPLTPAEKQVVEVIAQVVGASRALDAARIRPESSVFQLGVDSLGALTVAVRLRRMGYRCAATDVLQNPTIEQIARLAADNRRGEQGQILQGPSAEELQAICEEREALGIAVRTALGKEGSTACPSEAVESVQPCYPLQEVLVAHSHGDSGSRQEVSGAKYINHAIFDIDDNVDIEKLRLAWEKVITANEILRTCFFFWEENIVQLVLRPDCLPDLWCQGLSGKDASTVDATLKSTRDKVAVDMVSQIDSRPPLRLTLATSSLQDNGLQHGRRVLMLSIHHALYDADSLSMLVHDVQTCYNHDVCTSRPSTAPLADYMAWQKRHSAPAKTHWTSLLSNWETPETPSPDDQMTREDTTIERVFKLPLSELKDLCSKMGLTLPALLQGLFGFVLARSRPSTRATFGVVLSGRTIGVDDVDQMMAPCITTVPQVVDLASQDTEVTLAGIISTVQANAFASMAYQHTSLRDIQAWVEASGSIFDSIFSFVTPPAASETSAEQQVLRLVEGEMPLDYPLALECEADAGQDKLTLRAGYATSMAAVAENLLESIEILSKAVLRGDHIPVAQFGPGRAAAGQSTMAKFDETSWSDMELRIRDLIMAFCSVELSKITKAAPLVRFGIDSITAIRFARRLREDGLGLSSADVLRNPSVGALAALCTKREQEAEATQAVDGALDTIPSSTTSSGILSTPSSSASDSDGRRGSGSQHEDSGATSHSSMASSVLSASALSTADIPKDAKPWAEQDEVEIAYQATPLQAGMLSSTLALDGRLYSHHHAYVLPSTISLMAVEAAWSALLAKHDILRTSFHAPSEATGSWVAAVHNKPLVLWNVVDARDNGGVDSTLRNIAQDTVFSTEHAFDERPPVKVTIVCDSTSSTQQKIFVASLHHAVYDGISVQFIFSDLQRILADLAVPHRPPFHAAATAIARSADAASAFWTKQLQGYTGAHIPDLAAADAPQSSASINIPSVASFRESANTTILNASLLAFGKALALLCGTRDVVFGSVVAGRSSASLEHADAVAGPMFNTLPWRVRLADITATNQDALDESGKLSDSAIEFQHVSLAEVQRRWRTDVGEGRELFEALFVFNKEPGGEVETGEDDVEQWKPCEIAEEGGEEMETRAGSEYAMNFEVVERRNGGVMVQVFARMEAGRLERFVNVFRDALDDVLGHHLRLALAVPEGLVDLSLSATRKPSTTQAQAGDGLEASGSSKMDFNPDAISEFLEPVCAVLAEATATSGSAIGAQTSVFSIGVDSILAIRVAAACKQRGVPVTTTDVIRGVYVGKICELAFERKCRKNELLDKQSHEKGGDPNSDPQFDAAFLDKAPAHISASVDDIEEVLPALPGQEYQLASWLQSGRTMYEPTWVFRSREALDKSRLQAAWVSLRKRHSILRTCFVAVNPDHVVQVVLNENSVLDNATEDPYFMAHAASPAQTDMTLEGAVKRHLHDLFHTPSTMSTPPVRLTLVHGSPAQDEGDAVLLTLHHATFDAWGMGLLARDLISLYHASSPSNKDSIKPISPTPSFSGVAKTVAASAINPRHQQRREAESSFWHSHLTNASSTILGASASPSSKTSGGAQTFVRSVAYTSKAVLEETARRVGVTPHALLLAAFARAVAEQCNSQTKNKADGPETTMAKPTFGFYTAGRSAASFGDEDELSLGEVAGPLLNVLPFAVSVDGNDTLYLVKRVQEELGARAAWEQSRLRDVLEWWRDASGHSKSSGQKQELFNAHLNVLWSDDLFVANRIDEAAPQPAAHGGADDSTKDTAAPLLEVWPLGMPSDYASPTPIPGTTAVDLLDTSIVPQSPLFVDVGPDAETGCIAFGAGCAEGVMDQDTLGTFVERIGGEIEKVVAALR